LVENGPLLSQQKILDCAGSPAHEQDPLLAAHPLLQLPPPWTTVRVADAFESVPIQALYVYVPAELGILVYLLRATLQLPLLSTGQGSMLAALHPFNFI